MGIHRYFLYNQCPRRLSAGAVGGFACLGISLVLLLIGLLNNWWQSRGSRMGSVDSVESGIPGWGQFAKLSFSFGMCCCHVLTP